MKENAVRNIIILAVFALITVIIIIISLRPALYEENNVYATGRHDLDFRVFYFHSNIFDESPVPQNLNFLMSYTDYIEIENSFLASFSREVDIHYSYVAEKRFVIRHITSADANLSPIVFEEVFILSEVEGNVISNFISFSELYYRVTPRQHIDRYFEFVDNINRQIAEQGIFPQGPRGFSAELWIDFTHKVEAPEIDFLQTSTRGYRIALTTEVYAFTITGGPQNFDFSVNLAINENEVSFLLMSLLIFILILCISGIVYSFKILKYDDNSSKNEANIILSKYSKEIVIYKSPVSKMASKFIYVDNFEELLKLAISVDKLIMCYRNDSLTQFSVIVEGFASVHEIRFTNIEEEDYKISSNKKNRKERREDMKKFRAKKKAD